MSQKCQAVTIISQRRFTDNKKIKAKKNKKILKKGWQIQFGVILYQQPTWRVVKRKENRIMAKVFTTTYTATEMCICMRTSCYAIFSMRSHFWFYEITDLTENLEKGFRFFIFISEVSVYVKKIYISS